MEEGLGKVERERLPRITRNADLSAYLLLRSSQHSVAQRLLHHLVKFAADKAQTAVDVLRVATEVDRPQSCVRIALRHALHRIDQSVPLSQRYVEPCRHARSTEDVVKEVESYAALVPDAVRTGAEHHVSEVRVHVFLQGLRHVGWESGALGSLLYAAFHDGHHRLSARRQWAGTLQQLHQTTEVDVAIREEHAVLRAVITCGEALCVRRSVSSQLISRPQNVVSEGMSFVYGVLEEVVDEFGRRVVIALNLVDYHLHLLVNLRLRIRTVKDDVGKQVHGTVDVILQHGGMIDRLLLVGEGVEVAAHTLQIAENLHRASSLGALEGHVFAEVRHSLLPSSHFVSRSGCHGIPAVDHG